MADADPARGALTRYVGKSVTRREDTRLVTGNGTFVANTAVGRVAHAAFVRSEVARGSITRIDTVAACTLPGVIAVFTSDDLERHRVGGLWSTLVGPPSPARLQPPVRPLAGDAVHYVGDPIAIVLAHTKQIAVDAASLVELEIDPHAAIVDPDMARVEGASLVHPDLGTNVASEVEFGDAAAVDAAFERAHHVFTRTLRQARATNVPMEPRGLIARWNAPERTMRIWCSSQNPHEVRALCARLLGISESHVRASIGDVGGGFGQKVYVGREDAAVMLASVASGVAVQWIEDRTENLIAANHARVDRIAVELAVDAAGNFLAARVEHLEDVGAYPWGGAASVGRLVGMMFPGPYRLPLMHYRSTAVFTNTCGRAPYRGPWLVETLGREAIVDHAARQLGIDPIELRRRNVLTAADLPHTTPGGATYGTTLAVADTIELAATEFDYETAVAERDARRREGRLAGIGIAVYVEPSAAAFGPLSSDQATIRVEPSGTITVWMGTGSSGNSVETTIPQVVADTLGCRLDRVVLHQGDTDSAPFGPGTVGSRSAPIAGGAARLAAEALRAKLLTIAAHLLEAAADDLAIDDDAVFVRGSPAKRVALAEIAEAVHLRRADLPPDAERSLEASVRFQPDDMYTWSTASHLCTCEIDPETYAVRVERYVVAEDCGVIINPMVVAGQVAGGVAQGIGGALLEEFVYDDTGVPLTSTLLDYLIPSSTEVPNIDVRHLESPSTLPGGHKGMAEGGAIGAPAAVFNAVADALAPLGCEPSQLPLSPLALWRLVHHSSTRQAIRTAEANHAVH